MSETPINNLSTVYNKVFGLSSNRFVSSIIELKLVRQCIFFEKNYIMRKIRE